MFKVYDESESRNDWACLCKIFDEPESRIEGACLSLRYMMDPESPNDGLVLSSVLCRNSGAAKVFGR